MHLCNRKQVHPVEDVGISPWPVDVVEFGRDAYAHRKQVDVKQLYNQVPQTTWVSSVPVAVGDKMPAEWEPAPDRGLGPSGSTVEQPSRMRKKWCYGQKNFGSICSSLFPSPTQLLHTTNINPFITLSRIKCERYIFIKKRVRLFIEPRYYVWLCFRIYLYMYCVVVCGYTTLFSLSIRP